MLSCVREKGSERDLKKMILKSVVGKRSRGSVFNTFDVSDMTLSLRL